MEPDVPAVVALGNEAVAAKVEVDCAKQVTPSPARQVCFELRGKLFCEDQFEQKRPMRGETGGKGHWTVRQLFLPP